MNHLSDERQERSVEFRDTPHLLEDHLLVYSGSSCGGGSLYLCTLWHMKVINPPFRADNAWPGYEAAYLQCHLVNEMTTPEKDDVIQLYILK